MHKKCVSKSPLVVIYYLTSISSTIQNLLVILHVSLKSGYPSHLYCTKILFLLFFRAKNSVKHYPVRWDGQEFQFGFGRFTSVDELREHCASRPVIGGESGTTHTCSSYHLWYSYTIACTCTVYMYMQVKFWCTCAPSPQNTIEFYAYCDLKGKTIS